MKLKVQLDGILHVGGGGKPGLNLLQGSQGDWLHALGGEAGHFRLHQQAHLDELAQAVRRVGNQQGQRAVERLVELVHHLDADAVLDLDQPLQLQPLGRFADDGAAHAQLLGELALRRQPAVAAVALRADFRGEPLADIGHQRSRAVNG